VFLPANTTSVVQPCDQGIIACTKAHYRRMQVEWVVQEAEKDENKSLKELRPNFYQMMRWLNKAWNECVPPVTIRNCWSKADILPDGWVAKPTGTRRQRAQAAQGLTEQSLEEETSEHAADSTESAEIVTDTEASQAVFRDAFDQLDAALQQLQESVQRNSVVLPHGDNMMSAAGYCDLDGEREVFAELDDEAIVRMVQTDNADIIDSDEHEDDDFVEVSTTPAQALQLASELHTFALSQPQLFDLADINVLSNMQRKLSRFVATNKKQTTMTAMFARQ
jgi:hypothetical protein